MNSLRMILAGSLLAGVAMAGGCKKNATEEARDKVEDKQEQVADKREDLRDEKKDVNAEVKDVKEEMKDVHSEQTKLGQAEQELAAARAELTRAIDERVLKVDAKIAELERKADKKSKDLAAAFRVRRDEAKMKLVEAKNTTKENWLAFQSDVSTRWDKLEKDVDDAL